LYAHGFRIYFTPLSGVLFAFPSRYWFTIGQLGVFSLGGWSPHVQSRFHVSRPTHRTQLITPFRIRGHHPLWPAFPDRSPMTQRDTRAGLLPVRSPLLGESRLISSPAGTEMFQFPAFASPGLCVQPGDTDLRQWVSPFGHRRIKAWLPAPRRFSQVPTSFIASSCQGIHRVRLFA
jgi:hypothetical protein